jgi:hypothetical protein
MGESVPFMNFEEKMSILGRFSRLIHPGGK